LTQPTGILLGLHDEQYLRHEGPEHVLAFAPTRSGKGVGLVLRPYQPLFFNKGVSQ